MKRKLLFLLFAILSEDYALADPPVFGWNKALTASAGYWKVYRPFGADSYGNRMPTNLLATDANLCGVYVGVGLMSYKTGYNVYGYDESIATWVLKFGPSLRLLWEESECKLTFTPYCLYGFISVGDTSGNAIGQRQDYGNINHAWGVGLKLTFAYKHFEAGVSTSNREFGVSIGYNYDF